MLRVITLWISYNKLASVLGLEVFMQRLNAAPCHPMYGRLLVDFEVTILSKHFGF